VPQCNEGCTLPWDGSLHSLAVSGALSALLGPSAAAPDLLGSHPWCSGSRRSVKLLAHLSSSCYIRPRSRDPLFFSFFCRATLPSFCPLHTDGYLGLPVYGPSHFAPQNLRNGIERLAEGIALTCRLFRVTERMPISLTDLYVDRSAASFSMPRRLSHIEFGIDAFS